MKTKTKVKRENRKRLKTKTKKLKTKTKMPKQQNFSLNESASILLRHTHWMSVQCMSRPNGRQVQQDDQEPGRPCISKSQLEIHVISKLVDLGH